MSVLSSVPNVLSSGMRLILFFSDRLSNLGDGSDYYDLLLL